MKINIPPTIKKFSYFTLLFLTVLHSDDFLNQLSLFFLWGPCVLGNNFNSINSIQFRVNVVEEVGSKLLDSRTTSHIVLVMRDPLNHRLKVPLTHPVLLPVRAVRRHQKVMTMVVEELKICQYRLRRTTTTVKTTAVATTLTVTTLTPTVAVLGPTTKARGE